MTPERDQQTEHDDQAEAAPMTRVIVSKGPGLDPDRTARVPAATAAEWDTTVWHPHPPR